MQKWMPASGELVKFLDYKIDCGARTFSEISLHDQSQTSGNSKMLLLLFWKKNPLSFDYGAQSSSKYRYVNLQ